MTDQMPEPLEEQTYNDPYTSIIAQFIPLLSNMIQERNQKEPADLVLKGLSRAIEGFLIESKVFGEKTPELIHKITALRKMRDEFEDIFFV